MYAKRNQIYIGSLTQPDYYFENDQISVASTTQAVAMVGQELSVDTFSPVVSDASENLMDIIHFRSSDGKEIETGVGQIYAVDITESSETPPLINIQDGTPLWYYHNEELVGKFFVSSVKRVARNKFQIESVSAIGKLDKTYHGGGLFQASTFGDVLAHILASGIHGPGSDPVNHNPPVIDYIIDDDVAALPVSGWLPYASKRNNLYQLIFSNGVNIVKNIDGNPRFTFIHTGVDIATPIEDSRIFYGGNVEYTKPYSKVSIMEHTYIALTDAEPVTLYDNTLGVQVLNKEIWFDNAPIIVSTLIASENLTVVSATENGAVISGNGTLTGVPYTHTTRTVSRSNPSGKNEKVVSVESCTMVNFINSENLLNRLYAFYCPGNYIKKITNSIRLTKERCGKAYSIRNPHGEQEIAYLASMDSNASSFVKSDCEWYANYTPVGQQGLYQHVAILTPTEDPKTGELVYEGDWELPENTTQIKVVMIGGGTGGYSGYPGENGVDADAYIDVEQTADLAAVWYGAEGGAGGGGGEGGTPGRVKVVVIENPTSTFHYVIGKGGEGGGPTDPLGDEDDPAEVTPNPGTDGTVTTFGVYSTSDDDGFVPTGGVYDPINGDWYALKGRNGTSGGNGGARKIEADGYFAWATDGEDVTGADGTVYHGGKTGMLMTDVEGLPECKLIAYGGNGAGAAVGIDRDTHEHINGGSDQTADWNVTEDQ